MAAGKHIYPPLPQVFSALDLCPFDKVSVVIVGQDPYHGPGQAHGLCFSVVEGIQPPPSLINIFKELESDPAVDFRRPKHGSLVKWAQQGVLMLNACLTVRRGDANSHQKHGWEAFTDAVIAAVNRRRSGVVFLLWGKPAAEKCKAVDSRRHHVLTAPHPSPLSAARGFFGCRHFSKANALLRAAGRPPIDWQT
jgi:uracil-DNA glycosylase